MINQMNRSVGTQSITRTGIQRARLRHQFLKLRIDITEGDLDAKFWQGASWTFVDKLKCLHYSEDHFLSF
ncbi:UNVERIFIED_CONTAM: hypothetical protein FKN15_047658 [Acipenser sinensis]